ncbi:RNA-binding family protein [Striga asiatica]|uniref:RNA-binding family protein n=1 Tax=Striga asiatica TaxID=4170 RepID=A0A5A7QI22_STRAF|nr:RNA-binding family protein [Striga asiatica]
MAFSCSPCKLPIIVPNLRRNYAIQRPTMPKTSISKTPNFKITQFSVSTPSNVITDTFIQTAKHSSNLNSPDELDIEAPSNVIVFIKGLAQSTSEGGLKAAFSRCGQVSQVKIFRDKKTKLSLGSAFVWFVVEEHARAAVDEMNGKFFEGRFIHVSLAKPKSCKTRLKRSPYKF